MRHVWQKNGWTLWHVLGSLAMLALAVWACLPAWTEIVLAAWNNEEDSHIFLVPFVAAWLVWIRKGRMRRIRPTSQWVGLMIVILGAALYIGGYEYDIYYYRNAGAIVVAVGALFSILGVEVMIAFMPAICVLIFAIPVPGTIRQHLAIKMQWATAMITQQIFDLLGVAVEQFQNMLSINGQKVKIVEACNGLRMVFALVLVSYAFAFSTPLRGYVRFLVIILSPVSAIVCNVIRLIPTIYFFGALDTAQAEKIHNYLGWPMLPLAFLILMGIIRLLRWALLPVEKFTLAYD